MDIVNWWLIPVAFVIPWVFYFGFQDKAGKSINRHNTFTCLWFSLIWASGVCLCLGAIVLLEYIQKWEFTNWTTIEVKLMTSALPLVFGVTFGLMWMQWRDSGDDDAKHNNTN